MGQVHVHDCTCMSPGTVTTVCFGQGYDEFYTGSIAKDITDYFAKQEGGLLSMDVSAASAVSVLYDSTATLRLGRWWDTHLVSCSGPRQLLSWLGGAHPHDLPWLRYLQQPIDDSRRNGGADGSEPAGGLGHCFVRRPEPPNGPSSPGNCRCHLPCTIRLAVSE